MVALDAAKIISKKNPKLNFVLLFVEVKMKKKRFLKKLEKRIYKLGLNNRVIFSGNLNDMPAVYSIADIVF